MLNDFAKRLNRLSVLLTLFFSSLSYKKIFYKNCHTALDAVFPSETVEVGECGASPQ